MLSSASTILNAIAAALGGWQRIAFPVMCFAGAAIFMLAGVAANVKHRRLLRAQAGDIRPGAARDELARYVDHALRNRPRLLDDRSGSFHRSALVAAVVRRLADLRTFARRRDPALWHDAFEHHRAQIAELGTVYDVTGIAPSDFLDEHGAIVLDAIARGEARLLDGLRDDIEAAQPRIDPERIPLFTPETARLAELPEDCAQTVQTIAILANGFLLDEPERLTNTQKLTVARTARVVAAAVRAYRRAKRNDPQAAHSALATALASHESLLREIMPAAHHS